MAAEALESPIDGVFGAAEVCPNKDMPTEVAMYLRQTCALSNNYAVLKGASFTLDPKKKALSQSLPDEAHTLVLPGDSISTDIGALKGAFGLEPGAIAARNPLEMALAAPAAWRAPVRRSGINAGFRPSVDPLRLELRSEGSSAHIGGGLHF